MSYPSNWTKVKFCEIAKRKSVRINSPKDSGYERYVGLEHLDTGELVVKRWGSNQDVSSSMQLFNKKDILFARRNTYLRRVSVAPFDGVCSGDIIVIEPILNHIVTGFLPIYMQFEEFENRVVAWSAGAFSKRIKWKQLCDFEVWLPPKEEQQKIVDTIWGIQITKEKTANAIRTIDKLKSGLIEILLTKGIGDKKFRYEEIGLVPETWKVVKLGDVTSIRYGLGQPPELEQNGVPMIRATNIKRGAIVENNLVRVKASDVPKSKNAFLEEGDIIIVRSGVYAGDIGYVSKNWEGAIAGYDLVMTPSREVCPIYLLNCMLSPGIQSLFSDLRTRSAQYHLNSKQVAKIKIMLPPLYEQEKIVSILDSFSKALRECNSFLINTSELENKLIDSFMSGETPLSMEVIE